MAANVDIFPLCKYPFNNNLILKPFMMKTLISKRNNLLIHFVNKNIYIRLNLEINGPINKLFANKSNLPRKWGKVDLWSFFPLITIYERLPYFEK